MWILLAILALGLIIIVHEGGHYLVARWCKMKVDRFSLGFGPALATWKRKETEFTLAPIPFGGFVAIRGMNIAEEVDPDDPYVYPNRPLWQRMAAIFAGPAANYLAAVVLAIIYFGVYGVPTGTAWFGVKELPADSAAAGVLEPGDRIIAINGDDVYAARDGKGDDLLETVQEATGAGQPISVTFERAGERRTADITPRLGKVTQYTGKTIEGAGCSGDKRETVEVDRYLLGIQLEYQEERTPAGAVGSVKSAFVYPVLMTKSYIAGLYGWAQGTVDAELQAPPKIVQNIAKSFEGGWKKALEYLMLFNVWLGLLNLLPLPALDGGRLMFLGYEMATRRRPNPKIEATVHMVGIMFFLLLILAVSGKEIFGMFVG